MSCWRPKTACGAAAHPQRGYQQLQVQHPYRQLLNLQRQLRSPEQLCPDSGRACRSPCCWQLQWGAWAPSAAVLVAAAAAALAAAHCRWCQQPLLQPQDPPALVHQLQVVLLWSH